MAWVKTSVHNDPVPAGSPGTVVLTGPGSRQRISYFWTVPRGSKDIRFEIPYIVRTPEAANAESALRGKYESEVMDDIRSGVLNFDSNDPNYMNLIEEEVQRRFEADPDYLRIGADGYTVYPRNGIAESLFDPPSQYLNSFETSSYRGSTSYQNYQITLFMCYSHGASLQVFHTNGKLLTGSLLTGYDKSRAGLYDDSHYPANVSQDYTDGRKWFASGLWADFHDFHTVLGHLPPGTPTSSYVWPTPGRTVTPSMVTDVLRELHPNVFGSAFNFDDTSVNQGRGEQIKYDDSTEYTFSVDGEEIIWTGCIFGTGPCNFSARAYMLGLYPYLEDIGGGYPVDPIVSRPYEVLRISEAKEDLIIGFISDDGGCVYGEWYTDDGTPDPTPDPPPDPPTPDPPTPPEPPTPPTPEPPAYPNQIRYTNLEEVTPVRRGDDIVIPQPYAGIAVFRDGRYIVAGREKGRLVLVGPDDLVISSGDPFSLRHDYDKLICYGIAMHVSEESLYLLVGEEGSTDLYITRIEIIGRPSGCSAKCDCDDDCDCTTMSKIPADAVAFQGNYYKVYDQVVTWEEARIECERLGGHLCTIMSKEENNCVKELVSKAIGTPPSRWYGAWIGCYGDQTQWYWVNGAKVSYTSWTPGQPDYVGSGPVYQGVIMVDGLWHDYSIGGKCNHFVCKWTGYPQPKSIPHDAVKFQRHYYKVYKQNVTWEEARTLCSNLGGHLAIITSQEENNLVQSLVSKAIGTPTSHYYGAWIGCERRDNGWYWVDDSKVNYTNWDTGQPDAAGGTECYGEIIVDGYWNDYHPYTKLDYFVCEWPEIDPGSPRFKWNPAFDIRLPSMTAKNIDYNDFQPIYWGVGYELGGYSPNGLQWITHLLKKKQPDVINDWSKLHDDLAVNLTQFPMIGPILPEYKPCITGVGARVMVSVVNVQVYQCSFDMKVWYENTASKDEPWRWRNSPSSVRAMWESTLRSILKKRNLIDETKQQTTLDGPGIRTPPVLEDWFPEGKDKSWWVEPIYTYNKYGEIVYYHGCWLHQKVTFQYPFPASSVVTVYPDLGMIEGIAHIGSGTVCAVPRDVDVTEEFSWSRYTKYPASLDADHKDLNKYMATGIMAAEADIDLMLSPLEYYIPSNVLAWADGFLPLKWKGGEVTTITALTQFMEEYWLDVYLYQQKLDPVAYVRKRQQDTTFVKLGSLKENKLCRTRRDGARKGESAAEDYVAGPLVYPWSVIDGIQSACTEICSGVMMAVTPTKIYRGDVALHKFISIYEGRVIGEGLDIYIGKVLIGKEKIVKVKLQHAGYSMMQLKNFKIEIIADMNFPYWQYVELSLDKTTWSRSITWNKRQLMPVSELYNAEHYEFEFWVKVLCSSTYDDPKPVKVKTTYERTGS